MNELFNTLFEAFDDQMQNSGYCTTSYAAPKVDISETKDAYTIEMDLPGKTENDINIELDRNTLKISSIEEAKPEAEEKGETKENKKEHAEKLEVPAKRFLIKERSTSKFSRSFTLPEDIDEQNIAASFKNGVLNIIVPRKELAAPKRIAITA